MMTLQEAYRALEIQEGASEEERRQAYQALRDRLEEKRVNAPTPGLKQKYQEAFKQIDEAIERVETSIDAQEMPIFSSDSPRPTQPQAVSTKPTPNDETETPSNDGRNRLLLAGSGIIILVLCVFIWLLKGQIAEGEKAVSESLRFAEEVEQQEEARRTEENKIKELKADLAKKRIPIEEQLAPLRQYLQTAEIKLRDLQGMERLAADNSAKKASASYQRIKYKEFLTWLQTYANEIPSWKQLENTEQLEAKGKLVEAIEALGDPTPLPVDINATLAQAETERFTHPVEKHLAEQNFAAAEKESELAFVKRNYQQAIELIEVFSENRFVGEKATTKLESLYQQKANEVFKRAQHAFDIGEIDMARSILETLDNDPNPVPPTKSQLDLIGSLNSEYALDQAILKAEDSLDNGDFKQARDSLQRFADDPYVRIRAKHVLMRIDEIEQVWGRNAVAIETESQSESVANAATPIPDTLPKLIRKEAPVYPDSLRQSGVRGYVDIVCIVGTDGKPMAIDILKSSNAAFEAPTLEALKKWRFKPAEKDGVPIALKVRQRIQFNP